MCELKRLSFRFDKSDSLLRPLRSTDITPLPRYYGPVRLPDGADAEVMSSRASLRLGPHPVGPPRCLGRSFGARPPQLPRAARRLLRFVPSPSVTGFSSSGSPAAANSRNEAESGSLTLGFRPSLPQESPLGRLVAQRPQDRPTFCARSPSHRRPQLHVVQAVHMANSFQLARSTRLGLAYRTGAGGKVLALSASIRVICGSISLVAANSHLKRQHARQEQKISRCFFNLWLRSSALQPVLVRSSASRTSDGPDATGESKIRAMPRPQAEPGNERYNASCLPNDL